MSMSPEKSRSYMAERRRQRREAGLCVDCGQDAGGKSRCPECMKSSEASPVVRKQIEKRFREKHRDRLNATQKAKKTEWAARGLCTTCGKRPPESGCASCASCLEKYRKRSAAAADDRHQRRAAQRLERIAAGLCPQCGKAASPGSQLCERHREMQRVRSLEFARRNPSVSRARHMKSKYGVTAEQWDAMLEAQGGRCAICRGADPGNGRNWHIDHNHATGAVRGLLCNGCNAGLGMFRDDPVALQRAARYVVIKGGATNERQASLIEEATSA